MPDHGGPRSIRSVLRPLAAALAAGLALPGLVALALPASADTAPVAPATRPTVTADALPTVQVNGVVWDQLVVGDRVYATGSFTAARPAGAAPGANQTARANLLAYSLSTGTLDTAFVPPKLDAQGLSLAASADGSRLFVAGDFTRAGSATTRRVVALDAATGALVTPFAAGVNGRVRALAVANGVLYAGGTFTTANGVTRTRLAAFDTRTGALLAWKPAANREVMALTAPATSGALVVGGRFTTLAGSANYGLGAVDRSTGAALPFAANQVVRDAGDDSAIYSLSNDGDRIYGTGYVFGGGGNLEGSFSAGLDGSFSWVTGCLGDTYDTAPAGGVLYTVGHPHDCSAIGAFGQSDPLVYQHALAVSTTPGTHGESNLSGAFAGRAAPELLHWYPTLANGTYTGQNQAAWSVATGGGYVALGGEFPTANGVAQQGLVRFATKALAPGSQGPAGGLTPSAAVVAPGAVRISWPAAADPDNRRLTYDLLRDGAVIATLSRDSSWWDRPAVAYTDTSFPGGSASYQVRVHDADGTTVTGPATQLATPAAATAAGKYADEVRADGAVDYWRLGESSAGGAYDWAGGTDLTLTGVRRGAAGAISRDADEATTFGAGDDAGVPGVGGDRAVAAQEFSAEAWFRTTSKDGGTVLGFGSSATDDSATADRQVYLGPDGRLSFGVRSGGKAHSLTSGAALNDDRWHHVVATLGASGMRLYVDGKAAGADAATTYGDWYQGYWRVGGDAVAADFADAPAAGRFAGSVDEVAVYPTVLEADQVANHYTAGANEPPTADFTATADLLSVAFDAGASADPDGTIATYAWDFGDGTTGTGVQPAHTYAAAGTYSVKLTVTDDAGATATATHDVTTRVNQPPAAAFTATPDQLSVAFDGSASADPDGSIASYAWDFGDGTTGTGVSPTHVYAAGGVQSVTLTVTDDRGDTATVTHDVRVNQPPTAAFTATPDQFSVAFDGSASADPDGSIASYAWDFGDGTTGTGVSPTHVYAAGGVQHVTLTVTDDAGATATVTHDVRVNQPPTAAFTATPDQLSVVYDGSASADPDGSIAAYAWDFGDGTTGSGGSPTHVYAAGGVYHVTLTVTDDAGATATVTHDVRVNQPPTAAFSAANKEFTVSVDASASADPDGSVVGYAWDFGDGANATGVTAEHVYEQPGKYPIRLTVTDDDKATATVVHRVLVVGSGLGAIIGYDEFDRAVDGGWGTAELGGAWTTTGAGASVAGDGSLTATAATAANAQLPTAWADVQVLHKVSLAALPAGGDVDLTDVLRRVGRTEYRAKVRIGSDGSVQTSLSKVQAVPTDTTLVKLTPVAGLKVGPGDALMVRSSVVGAWPSTIQLKVWAAGTPEPTAWTATVRDSGAALQVAGTTGFSLVPTTSVTGSVVAHLDDVVITQGS